MCSMPTASRISPGVTPVVSCSAGDSWAWVVDAGWMTNDRTSPMFARLVNSSSASVNV